MKCPRCDGTVYRDEDEDYIFCLYCGSIYVSGRPQLERKKRMEAMLTKPKDFVRPSRAKVKQ
jgi:DNA-directed RNA polymerase subunit RPC12/RpoP